MKFKEGIYYLSPTWYIVPSGDEFIIGNIFDSSKKICIKKISNITLNEELINMGLFIKSTDVNNLKLDYFKLLEQSYKKKENHIDCIETTSLCMYKCEMCVKKNNKIKRISKTMSMNMFTNIAQQLSSQETVVLHLFGDPLLDPYIIERIKILNELGLKPSFSTNLKSVLDPKFYDLCNLEIESLVLSIDSISSKRLSKIRGPITINEIKQALNVIKEFSEINKIERKIKNIIVQTIKMKSNELDVKEVQLHFKNNNHVFHFIKPFIDFPLTNSQNKPDNTYIEANEPILLYNLIGAKLPFKCLKPWNKSEVSILSDGNFVPCCMHFNCDYPLGNINTISVEQFFESEEYFEFRKKVWFDDKSSEICDNCSWRHVHYSHPKFDVNDLQKLKLLCIEKW